MKTSTLLLVLLAFAPPAVAEAQQTSQTPQIFQAVPTQSASGSSTPCGKQTSTPPRKPGWLEKQTKALACKQNRNFCDLPSSVNDATGLTPKPQPCPATTAPNPQIVKPAITGTATANQAMIVPAKPVYVCPPKSSLIPNYPYCLTADHSVVDAIQLPTSMSVPAPPAPAVSGPAQH